jgi:predicted ferric reductase
VVARLGRTPWARAVARFFGGYDRWRALHRTTGVFVAAGFLHGLLDGTAFDSAPLRWSYVVAGGIGLAFYAYREVLARHFVSLHDYQVDTVRTVQPGLVEVSLRPLGRPFRFVAGQFALLYLEGKDGWHRHPFSITSGTQEDVVRITVKALGDFTSSIQDLVEPGMPAGDRWGARALRSPQGRAAAGLDRRRRGHCALPELAALRPPR